MGCFSAPKTEMKSTLDPTYQSSVYNPFVNQLGGQLFGTPEQTITTHPGLPDYIKGFFTGQRPTSTTTVNPAVEGAFSGVTPDWAYQGQRVAPANALQNSAFQWAGSLPGSTAGIQNMALAANAQAAQPMDYNALIANSANLWNRTIMPSILNQQSGMDAAASGGTYDALARAGADLSSNLFAQITPLELQARQQRLAAAQNYGQIASMPLEALRYMNMLGGTQRDITQQGLLGNQQKWMEEQPWNHPLMQYLLQTGAAGQMTPVQKGGGLGYGMLGSMLGTAGAGLTGAGIGALSGAGAGAGALAAMI